MAVTPAEAVIEALGVSLSDAIQPITIGEYLKEIPGYGVFKSTEHSNYGARINPTGNGVNGQARVAERKIDTIKIYSAGNTEKNISNLPYHFFVLKDGSIVNKTPVEFTADGKISNLGASEVITNAGSNGRLDTANLSRGSNLGAGESGLLRSDAAIRWNEMVAAAAASGVTLSGSGYRPFSVQQAIWDKTSPSRRGTWVATPGYSNHGWGIAVDEGNIYGGGKNTPQYKWLAANACAFNFYQRMTYEPWHWEYAFNNPYNKGNVCQGDVFNSVDTEISIGLVEPVTPKTIGSNGNDGLDELVSELIKYIPSITKIEEGTPAPARDLVSRWLSSRRAKFSLSAYMDGDKTVRDSFKPPTNTDEDSFKPPTNTDTITSGKPQ